jgi:hypothetical protein
MRTSIDVDFGGIYGGNDYTTVRNYDQNGQLTDLKTCGGLALGMVQDTLVNGVPARVEFFGVPVGLSVLPVDEIEK